MAAAAIIFFAFYGFDAIATAAEEAKNPGRDLSIGIVGSMFVCVIIYMAVAAAAIGALAYTRFANSPEPLALILRSIGQPEAARFLALSAVIALPTVILAFFYGQSRIFFVMARDGLIPRGLARVSSRGSPVRITIFTAIVVAVLAGLIPLAQLAALANAGTLTAFIAVCVCMLVMRRRAPGRAAHLPDAARLADRHLRNPRLPLSALQPAAHDPDLVRLRAGGGARPLFPLWLSPLRRRQGGRLMFRSLLLFSPCALGAAAAAQTAAGSARARHRAGADADQRRRHHDGDRDPARADHRRQFPALCRCAPARRHGILPGDARQRARHRPDPGRGARSAHPLSADRA